ncbi:flagellar hook-length control protein FliK [Alkalicoccus chagannorensis]|uniref:flagellar hook-length control protein FliK n=1 Tax=Alkalicoccus chagannorensis TaxID=427072 RepID=UPI0004008D63|nr:flagellar hook-length control protein FliK [Alkalicoccus chagannorensis]
MNVFHALNTQINDSSHHVKKDGMPEPEGAKFEGLLAGILGGHQELDREAADEEQNMKKLLEKLNDETDGIFIKLISELEKLLEEHHDLVSENMFLQPEEEEYILSLLETLDSDLQQKVKVMFEQDRSLYSLTEEASEEQSSVAAAASILQLMASTENGVEDVLKEAYDSVLPELKELMSSGELESLSLIMDLPQPQDLEEKQESEVMLQFIGAVHGGVPKNESGIFQAVKELNPSFAQGGQLPGGASSENQLHSTLRQMIRSAVSSDERLQQLQSALKSSEGRSSGKGWMMPTLGAEQTAREMPVQQPQLSLHMQQSLQSMGTGGQQPEAARPAQEQFIRQFEQMLSRSSLQQLSNGTQQLSVRLTPENLGRLDITLQQVNGVMTARLMATTQMTRELLESQLHQLKQAFQGQNLQVERIEITQQQTQLWKDQQEENRRQQEQQNQAEPEADQELEEELDFTDFLDELLEESFSEEV